MTQLTRDQGEALVAVIHELRPDWNDAGIKAALIKASDLGTFAELCVAACRCAANPEARTPAFIAEHTAPHWQTTTPATTRPMPRMCVDHPTERASGCRICFKAAVPMPDGFAAPKRDRHLKVWQAGADGPWSNENPEEDQ